MSSTHWDRTAYTFAAAYHEDRRRWPYPEPLPMPRRLVRQRTKGWTMPEGAIFVGRARTADSFKWSNPHRWQDFPDHTNPRQAAVDAYCDHLCRNLQLATDARRWLRGHDLVCWCQLDQPCHADILLEIANAQWIDANYVRDELTEHRKKQHQAKLDAAAAPAKPASAWRRLVAALTAPIRFD